MGNIDILRELVQIERTGAVFYEDAHLAEADPSLRSLFARLAAHKQRILAALATQLPGGTRSVPFGGIIASALRSVYGDVLARLGRSAPSGYVPLLREVEQRLLAHYELVVRRIDDDGLKATLRAQIPRAHALVGEMDAVGNRLAA